MKTQNLFSKRSGKQESSMRYLVLCDCRDRKADDPKKEEIETLVREAIREHLESKKAKLNQAALEGAFKAANTRLGLACKGEEPSPAVSALVIAEMASAGKTHPEFLVCGVGDCRVYGIGHDKVKIAFSGPGKDHLGTSEKVNTHFKKLSGKNFPTLVALSQNAYSKVNDKTWDTLAHAGRDLPEKARQLIGDVSDHPQGWIVIPNATQDKAKRSGSPMRSAMLIAAICLAVVGAGMWLKGRKRIMKIAPPSVAMVEENEFLTQALEETELEMNELRDALSESMETGYLASLEELTAEAEAILMDDLTLEDELTQIGSAFEEELAAHRELLGEYKQEVSSLQEVVDNHDQLKAGYDELTAMLAEESVRLEQATETIETQDAKLATLKTELTNAGAEHVALLDKYHTLSETAAVVDEQATTIETLESELANSEHEHIALLDKYHTLSEATESTTGKLEEMTDSHLQLANQKATMEADLELLRTALNEKEALLASTERTAEELTLRLEDALAESAVLQADVSELASYRDQYEQEHTLRLERDETLATLAVNIEGWRKAVSSMEQSREELANELAELRTRQKELMPSRAISAEMGSVKRIHLVSPGETLESIAHRYYSDYAMVDAIVEANHDALRGSRQARVGTALVIP